MPHRTERPDQTPAVSPSGWQVRADPELADILVPAETALAAELTDTAREVVPEWDVAGRQFEIGCELAICTIRAMALKVFSPGTPEPSEEFFCYVARQLADLAREGQPGPNGATLRTSAASI